MSKSRITPLPKTRQNMNLVYIVSTHDTEYRFHGDLKSAVKKMFALICDGIVTRFRTEKVQNSEC